MVTLRNKTRRVLSFNLEHEAMCRAGACRCQSFRLIVTDHNRKTGVKAKRAVEKTLCPSLTLLPLEVQGGLDDGVLQCREVKAARKGGRIEVVAQTPAGATVPSPPAPPATIAQAPDPLATSAQAASPPPANAPAPVAPAGPGPGASGSSATAIKKEATP